MPVSSSVHITDSIEHILRLNPRSVLDIGCGFGLWGFLCREYLDVWNERVQPADWQTRIDGVELWEPYIQTHQRALYNNIIIKDVREAIPDLGEYELVIAGDVIEHLDKPDAEWVLEELYSRATRAMLVNIPLTGHWDHAERHGNPGELHRSQWTVDDFAPYPSIFREYKLPCGEYGSFFCPKDCPPDARLAGLQHAAQQREESGDTPGAIRALQHALALQPALPEATLHLVDLLLKHGDTPAATDALRAALTAMPSFHFARLTLARLLAAQGDNTAAAREAQFLLADPTVDTDTAAQARTLIR